VQDLVGRNLGGRYRLLGLLGSGGMGAVFEAEQSGLRRRVAVKVLRSPLADRASPRARWVLSTRRRPVRMRVIMTTIIGQAGRPFNVDEADGVNGRHRVALGLTGDPNGGGRPAWPRHDPAVDRLLHFTNSGVIIGTDPLTPRLDLWQRVWSRGP
jgi:serine/threonine protein kinase